MGAIVGPWGLIHPAVVPTATAFTRSAIPSNCQRTKELRWAGLASFHATKAAVAPMTISPYPAGNAKTAGSMERACKRTKVNPTILQAWTDVNIRGFKDSTKWRKLSEAANHTENRTMGARAAIATARPMRFASFLNRCSAEAVNAKRNQAKMMPGASLA